MKVLWFTDSPSLASGFLKLQRNITGWIESLQKEIEKIEGLELGVVFPYGTEEENKFEIENTKYFSFPYPKSKKNISGFLSRWKHETEPESVITYYLKIVDEFKPDVIQIFGTESPFGLIIPHVKVPVVIHIQGNLTVYSKKWFSGLSNFDILRHSNLKTIFKAYGLWHLYYNFLNRAERERRLMQYCKYFIGRTDWDRRISKVLSPNRRYFHCEELLRIEFYHAEPWQKPVQSRIKLMTTISSVVYKGLETILDTAYLLRSNNYFEFEWTIAGIKGTEEVIKMIEKTNKLKFVDLNINFKGSLNSESLISELRQAHIYIHPSHIENSPNSVCEAMLLGMPVIATFTGGTPSIVANGIDGILIQDGDPFSLAGSIIELIENEDLMLTIADNARKKATVRHDKSKVKEQIEKIYKILMEESKTNI